MKKIIAIFFLAIIFAGSTRDIYAASSVSLSAVVVPKKLTDTINDFDLSNINPDALKSENAGSVKGASDRKANDLFYILLEVIAGLSIFGLMGLIRKIQLKKKNKLKSIQLKNC